MRTELLYNPKLMWDRLLQVVQNCGSQAHYHRRLARIPHRSARKACVGQLDSLELLELAQLPSNPVIIDIGAHAGEWTLLAKSLYPEAVVHAFEPFAPNHALFREHTRHLSKVTLHEVAVGKENAEATLHVPEWNDAASLLPMGTVGREVWQFTESREFAVTVIALDDYVARHELPLPDLIKLDIQGGELDALCGARHCLEHARWILCEVSFDHFYENQPVYHEIASWLAERHWRTYAFGLGTALGHPLRQTDVLFRHESGSSV